MHLFKEVQMFLVLQYEASPLLFKDLCLCIEFLDGRPE